MPDQNIGLLEQCPPAIDTGTLSNEAILSDVIEQVQLQKKEQPLSKPPEHWAKLEDPTSDHDLFTADEPTWLIKAKYYMTQLASLPQNWNSYGSPPVPLELLKNAQNFLNSLKLENIPPPFVAPVSGGGIQFEWHNEDRDLEVEFVEPLTVGYLKLIKDEPIEEGEFSARDYDSARKLIRWLTLGQS